MKRSLITSVRAYQKEADICSPRNKMRRSLITSVSLPTRGRYMVSKNQDEKEFDYLCKNLPTGGRYMVSKKQDEKEFDNLCKNLPTGGRYMVSEKQVRRSLIISVRLWSWVWLCVGECANPTPASHIYSQLSMEPISSGLSYKYKHMYDIPCILTYFCQLVNCKLLVPKCTDNLHASLQME